MTKLTTHVLNTVNGVPAKDMSLWLTKLDGQSRAIILATRTNNDGRCDSPLLERGSIQAGTYELEFEVEEYFGNSGNNVFLDCACSDSASMTQPHAPCAIACLSIHLQHLPRKLSLDCVLT